MVNIIVRSRLTYERIGVKVLGLLDHLNCVLNRYDFNSEIFVSI